MSKYVLDSFALLAFFHKQNGWERIKNLIQNANSGGIELFISIINMAEVKYMLVRKGKYSPQVIAAIDALPVTVVSADEYIEQVIKLKAEYAVSLAGCFGAAVALHLDCPIVTGDPEFKKLEKILKIDWLPSG